MSKLDNVELVTSYTFGLLLNPISWLQCLGNATIDLAYLPFAICHRIATMFIVLGASFKSDKIPFHMMCAISFVIIARNLVWDIPKHIVYVLLKFALCFVLIQFLINKHWVNAEQLQNMDKEQVMNLVINELNDLENKKDPNDDGGSFKA